MCDDAGVGQESNRGQAGVNLGQAGASLGLCRGQAGVLYRCHGQAAFHGVTNGSCRGTSGLH